MTIEFRSHSLPHGEVADSTKVTNGALSRRSRVHEAHLRPDMGTLAPETTSARSRAEDGRPRAPVDNDATTAPGPTIEADRWRAMIDDSRVQLALDARRRILHKTSRPFGAVTV